VLVGGGGKLKKQTTKKTQTKQTNKNKPTPLSAC
jgi:hypothetical protein